MPSPESVVLRLAEVRPCADDPELVHLVGRLVPPDPPLTGAAVDPRRSRRVESFATLFVSGPRRVAIELEDDGTVTVTFAESQPIALEVLQSIVACPVIVEEIDP
ncbi:MAG TPA: hypothetical protein VNS19_03335 [Acidimicrobiales bacterium]|jgi:hypothetical protein|nr:hypothetical protein [Acidimicrobiales bacterium]